MAAEFKISRFKYTWRGVWQTGTVYNPDDVISISGKVYACLERHTSAANFYTDLLFENNDVPPVPSPKWDLISDGLSFKEAWQPSTEYFIGDIVKFGGINYICVEGHTSVGNPSNFDTDFITNGYWTSFIESFDWKESWSTNTFYRQGDVVKYSGKLYSCNTSHTSSMNPNPGLLTDLGKWTEFVSNVSWKGSWMTNFLYKVDDIVRYGGKLYICINQHTSALATNDGLELNQGSWLEFLNGIEYKGAWTDNTKYKVNDVVKYGVYLYKCNLGHVVALAGAFDVSKWDVYCPGQDYSNSWSSATLYQPGDVVKHGGYIYHSNSVNLNSEPDWDQNNLNPDWALLLDGTRIRGEWNSSSTYLGGDVVRRNGQVYFAKRNVGINEDVDIIGDGSTINSDYWELLVPGSQWKGLWFENITYVIGDVVLYKGGSYRCIVKHASALANRPDDTFGLGTEWEQYTYRNPSNVLALIGDIKKYGTTGTENLNIGDEGQLLKVVNNDVQWSSFNLSQKVYYVSLSGIDGPDRGTTLNSSWRTLRYALDNVTGPATIFVKNGTYEEILPLRIPANVAVVGDELRGTIIKPARNYFSAEDISRIENIINFLTSILDDVITGITITNKLGIEPQSTVGPFGTFTEATYVANRLTIIKNIATNTSLTSLESTNTASTDPNILNSITQLENNIDFIKSEVNAYLENNYPSYNYNINIMNASVQRILDALKYDLMYTGTYKSIEAGYYFYYGSNYDQNKIQNMFLMRNGTGLRNCTLMGLEGQLSSYNTFLTKRPNAGAYASLDPGWGPLDSTAWVGTRSPYVQNVTTFGNACVGLKIDGSLHNGGNKTIVANDFTQVLSDGIGVWANGDAGTEVVSVFTYYNHIGYLCTNGGKIRGTNGNCSYGEYGAVAEGVDPAEIPITAVVNNRYYDASVGQVFTNGSNILKLFYSNAGQSYTTASYSVTGAGINASLLGDELRDGATYEVRIANVNDSTSPGGDNYTLNINNAQAGDNKSITLAASLDLTANELRNLRLVINSGTGAGQYGYIADWNNTTKIALIGRENFNTLNITSTTTGTNILTASSTPSQLNVGNAVCFTGDDLLGGISANTIYYVSSITGNNITLVDNLSNPVSVTTDSGTMQIHKLGWDHFQPGYLIETTLDTTSRYFIEPRLLFSAPTRSSTARELLDNTYWSDIAYGNGKWVAITDGLNNNGEIVNYSTDGLSWTQHPIASGGWKKIIYANGKFVAVAKDGKVATSTNGTTWSIGTIPSGEYQSLAYGDGYFVAVASGGTRAARSTNGITWSSVTLPEGADWSDIAYGKGIFVAVSQSDSSTAAVAYSTDAGASWTLSSVPGGGKSIAYGNNRFVIIEGGYAGANNTFISFDGINWRQGNIKPADYRAVTYGQGMFLAICAFENFASFSVDGLEWEPIELDNSINWASVKFGKDTLGKFIIIARDSNILSEVRLGTRTEGRAVLVNNQIPEILIHEPGSGYSTAPTLTILDPNNTADAVTIVKIANGVLGNPSIVNSGTGWATVSTLSTISGDGFADQYQTGNTLVIKNASRVPGPGDNLRITGIDDYVYKVLEAEILGGTTGNYELRLLIAKSLGSNESPEHETAITIRQRYSQVRLTNHDFLEVGLGNFEQTNYPNTLNPNGTVVSPQNEIKEADGGRCFYTSTDQDGNFRVGELFAVEQATGTVTINAEFFDLQGLEELRLGGVSVGGTGVVIREFSTDPLFLADSNNIIPTQKAIKEYIARRISGGGSDAFTTQFTAGIVRVGPNRITTTTLDKIQIPVKVNFKAPVNGKMLAMSYFTNTNKLFG